MEEKNHIHLVLNATVTEPITDETACKKWLEKLVEIIDMKILIPPVAKYCDTPGNEGVTGTVVIETSHASIHIWSNEPVPYIKMDVYSCKTFDPWSVVQYLQDTMGVAKGSFVILDRNGIIPDLVKSSTF